ncbi:MAG: ATP-grasp domain-containing protein [Melioribacteraceae bacterium]|nr:ATP-grasp domain-containing protein [Melioribacteraceae bacterium]
MIEANVKAFDKFQKVKPDIVFNVSEGINRISREAQIPAMLDFLNIPYTGSDPLTLAICLDKSRTKEILSYHNIPNPKFRVIRHHDELNNLELDFPLFIKPIGEGSSKGIFDNSLVKDSETLSKLVQKRLNDYQQPIILEEYLPGREFTVAILGNGSDLIVLPIIELNFLELPEEMTPIYSYEAKWILDRIDNPLNIYSCPAKIDKSLESKIRTISKDAYQILNCKDWSRIDVRLDKNGEPNIIEVNPLPGILPDPRDNSCYPKAARTYGIEYNALINQVLLHAAKRYNLL